MKTILLITIISLTSCGVSYDSLTGKSTITITPEGVEAAVGKANQVLNSGK